MTYNIHPILVHFPIALLLIYSGIKILPWAKWFPRVAWKSTEVILLCLGVLSAFVAASTGETAERLIRPDHQLVEMHSLFASISIFLYGALLLGEVLSFLTPEIIGKIKLEKINPLLKFIQKVLTHSLFSKILAFLGILAISVTGLLGGVMVYGLSADPLAPMVLNILGLTIN